MNRIRTALLVMCIVICGGMGMAGLLTLNRRPFTEQPLPEIVKEAEAEEPIVQENEEIIIPESIFHFANIHETETNVVDAILFDSMVKSASDTVKKTLDKNTSPREIELAMTIYNYMSEMNPKTDNMTLLELTASAIKYSQKYSAPLGLVIGVMQTESNFNPKALSSAGACGPMQVMWNIHKDALIANGITTRDALFTTDLGVAAGCLILSRYLRDERSVAGGLKRYYGALSGNYLSTTYSNWHTFELYASGIIKTGSKSALAKDRGYLASIMTGRSSKKTTSTSTPQKQDMTVWKGSITIKKRDGSTIVWRSEGK